MNLRTPGVRPSKKRLDNKLLHLSRMDVDHAEDALEQLTADYEHAKEIQIIDPTESLSIFRKIAFSGELRPTSLCSVYDCDPLDPSLPLYFAPLSLMYNASQRTRVTNL